MNVYPEFETEEDIQLIKEHTLLPILLDMLTRDIEELTTYRNKIIYNHVIYYLQDVEEFIYQELRHIRGQIKKRNISILHTKMTAQGIHVEYKVRGYIHQFNMLRSLVKAELMTKLMSLRRRLSERQQ